MEEVIKKKRHRRKKSEILQERLNKSSFQNQKVNFLMNAEVTSLNNNQVADVNSDSPTNKTNINNSDMDIVYLFRGGKSEELIYSIRSVVSNLPFSGKVFFVGGLIPRDINLEKVKYIHCQTYQNYIDIFNKKKYSTQNSLKLISENNEISENFILMNDDFYIMKPLTALKNYKMIKDLYDFSNNKYKPWFISIAETNKYLKSKYKTRSSFGNFELHVPMIINKSNLKKLFEEVPMDIIRKCQIRSLYGNMFLKDEDVTTIPDRKITQGQENKDIDENALFYSSVESAWDKSKLKQLLMKMFSKKSEYEL